MPLKTICYMLRNLSAIEYLSQAGEMILKQTNKECLARAPELQDGNSKSKHTNAFSCHCHNDNQTTDRV